VLRDAPVKTGASFEDYVAYEAASDERHEFVDGSLFVMPGGTKRHNFVTNRMLMKLFDSALQHGCHAFSSDVIVRVPSGKGYYPDVFVTCDSSLDSNRVVNRPSIIVAVLSYSTEIFDRGEKWEQYQRIPSREQYVLLSQHQPIAEVYSRQNEKWLYERLADAQTLIFSSLNLEVVLATLYEHLPEYDESEDRSI
jgi:Uma2 family endonuclease